MSCWGKKPVEEVAYRITAAEAVARKTSKVSSLWRSTTSSPLA